MQALFLVLNKTEYLDDILEGFLRAGVKGATIFESQGMGSKLADEYEYQDIPFFGSFKSMLENNRPFNKVIFTVCETDEQLSQAIQSVKDILGDMTKPGVGLMFTVPVGQIIGMTDPGA